MTFTWPAGVIGNVQTETPIALGNPQTSPLTGSTQGGGSSVIMWSLGLEFPPQTNLSNVRAVRNILAKAKQDTVAIQVRQPGLTIGSPGTITVAAGHTAGTKTLPLQGIAGGFGFVAGQFISVQTGGRWYLYTLDADSPAGASSRSVTLTSTTRAAHASGNSVEVSAPWIEGWIEQTSLTANTAAHYGFTLSIREAR
jgi:hypothetical protein